MSEPPTLESLADRIALLEAMIAEPNNNTDLAARVKRLEDINDALFGIVERFIEGWESSSRRMEPLRAQIETSSARISAQLNKIELELEKTKPADEGDTEAPNAQ